MGEELEIVNALENVRADHLATVAGGQGADDVHVGLHRDRPHRSVGEQKERGADVRGEEVVRITPIVIQGMGAAVSQDLDRGVFKGIAQDRAPGPRRFSQIPAAPMRFSNSVAFFLQRIPASATDIHPSTLDDISNCRITQCGHSTYGILAACPDYLDVGPWIGGVSRPGQLRRLCHLEKWIEQESICR
jgi:hypothetical protein